MIKIIPARAIPWYSRCEFGDQQKGRAGSAMDGGRLPFLRPRAALNGERMMSMDATHSAKQITATSLVQEVVGSYPQTIPVFHHHRMHCVGCYISPHHTIADCARENGVDIGALLNDLHQAISTAATRDASPNEKTAG